MNSEKYQAFIDVTNELKKLKGGKLPLASIRRLSKAMALLGLTNDEIKDFLSK